MEHFAEIGRNCTIENNAIVGFKYKDNCRKAKIGNNAVIRAFSIIYADVIIGDDFKMGHNVVIREEQGKKMVLGPESQTFLLRRKTISCAFLLLE